MQRSSRACCVVGYYKKALKPTSTPCSLCSRAHSTASTTLCRVCCSRGGCYRCWAPLGAPRIRAKGDTLPHRPNNSGMSGPGG